MQQMDTPYYGTSIDGSKEQNVKPNSTVSLTCRSLLMDTYENFDKESDRVLLKKITWNKDEVPLTGKVRRVV